MPKVLISDELSPSAIAVFRERGIETDFRPGLDKDELKSIIHHYDGLAIRSATKVTRPLIEAASRLKVVGRAGIGVDNVDVPAATQRGVILTNTPGVLDDATATHTMTLLLATARRIAESDKFVRDGKWLGWAPMFFVGLDVDRKTLGIAGLGRIGKSVAHRARAFDMKIIYSDVRRDLDFEKATGARQVDKDTLLRESDFLTLHVPLTPDTRHYIGERELKAMKPTAVLINASRGPVVDEKALVKALREHQIWGAGLDVFEDEPKLADGLIDLPNAVIVPHIASATPETRLAMGQIAVNNIIKVLNGGAPDTCVNPDVLKLSA